MGLADEIINGTYKNPYTQKKKKDEEVANQNVENNNTSGIFKKSNAFDDGYQFGDVSKTIGSTLANAGTSIIKGMGNVAEGVSDFGTHVAAQIIDWAGNKEWADRTRKRAIEDDNAQLFNGIQKNFEGNSVLGETSNQILESVGYSTALMPFEFISPHLGTAVMFTSATGSGLNEAYSQEGVTNTQAWIKGVGSGLIETATEKMFGLFGTSGLDTGIANTISSRITSGLGKSLVRMGVQGLGEAAEEGISYTANYILDRVIDNFSNGKGAKFSKEWNWEELGQQMGIAFVSASLMGMATNVAQVTQIATNEKINLKDAINEAGFRSDVKAQAEDLNNEIESIKKKLRKNPNNSGLANELKSKYAQLNMLVMKNNFMQDNTINNSKNVENNNINTQTQQVIPMQNKMLQNGLSEQIKTNIINKKVAEYVKQNANNFSTNININTDVIFNGSIPIDYKMQSQRTIFKKARELFSGINKNVFKNDNQNIYVNNTDISESINNTLKELPQKRQINENLAVFSQLDKIIENGKKISTSNIDNKGRSVYSNYEYYVSNVNIDRKPYVVEFDTRVQEGSSGKKERHFRLERVYNINEVELPTGTNKLINQFVSNSTSINNSIPQQIQNVKSDTINNYSIQNEQKNTQSILPIQNNMESLPDTKQFLTNKRSKNKVSIKEVSDTFAQRFVNKGHYIDKLADKTGNQQLKYKYDRTMNSFNEAQISIGEHQIDHNGNVVGKSLLEVFKPSEDANLKVEFEDYLANRHNISRDLVGKNIYGGEITAPQSSEIVQNYEKQYPQFKEWAKEVSKYNDNNLRDLVKAGMVSEQLYDNLKQMYGDYVPIYRDIVETMQDFEEQNKVGSNTLKRATQSGKKILSIQESMAEQTLSIKKAIRINEVGIELAKTLGKDSIIADKINFDPMAIETLGGDVIEKASDGSNIFTIFQDGEMSHFKISDEIYTAFSQNTLENKVNNSKVAKTLLTPVEKLSKAQRNLLTTYSIGFALNNPIKDIQDAYFNTKYSSATFTKNYIKALYQLGTKGDWYQSYINNGGNANTYFDYSKGLLPTKQNVANKIINKIKNINEVLEQAPRLAEYISTLEHGGTVDNALYNAADITTNFKRGGDITKAVNKYGVNFLNASVQGLDKLYRNITGQNGIKGYAHLLTKAAMFQIVPAILNGLLLGDDEDYEDLPEYTKDNYFLIKVDDGRFFRIPKGRVSSVVGGIARRALETAQGKEVDWSSIVDTTINQLAPNNPLTDNIVAPIIQAKNNKTWYGGDIVSSRLQKLPNGEQYDESTDKLSKFLGEKLNISPKKINYVLDQYSGGIGDVILPMMTPQAENNILEDKFTTDSVMKNKNVSKYYSKLEELEKNKNSANATDEDKIKYKYMSEASKELNDLYAQKREIQNSSLTDKQKKEQVREVQKKINAIVEEKLENLNNITTKSNTSKIGNIEYYKNNGEWTELSDEEKNKNTNISTETYSDYKQKLYNKKNEKVSKGEMKKTQDLKNKDKIQILLDSKYPDKEKESIYENYIKSSNDTEYTVMKQTGIDINEYLKYKQQDFTSDKKDDGTITGKTISNSKKKKFETYLNSMKITGNQRLLLYAMNGYTTTNSQKTQLANYVKNLKMDKGEKLKLYNKFSGFTVYKDGTVTW